MCGMYIRDAEMKDAEQLDALLTKLIQDEAQYDSNLYQESIITNNYGNRIGLDGHKLILIEDENKIIGYLYGFIYHIPEIYKYPIAIVDALYIEEKYRRKGYATMLVSEFKAFALKNRAHQVELKVVSANQAAVEFYKKLAFCETKKYMRMRL